MYISYLYIYIHIIYIYIYISYICHIYIYHHIYIYIIYIYISYIFHVYVIYISYIYIYTYYISTFFFIENMWTANRKDQALEVFTKLAEYEADPGGSWWFLAGKKNDISGKTWPSEILGNPWMENSMIFMGTSSKQMGTPASPCWHRMVPFGYCSLGWKLHEIPSVPTTREFPLFIHSR